MSCADVIQVQNDATKPGFSFAAMAVPVAWPPASGRTRTKVGGLAGEPSGKGFGGGGESVDVTSVEVVWLLGTSLTGTSSSDVMELIRDENTDAAAMSIELPRDRGAGDLRTIPPVKSTTFARDRAMGLWDRRALPRDRGAGI